MATSSAADTASPWRREDTPVLDTPAASAADILGQSFLERRGSALIGGFFRGTSRGSFRENAPDERGTGCCSPSPYWMAPFLFLHSVNGIGSSPVLQGIALELWAENAEIYFTFLGGFGGFLGIFAGPIIGTLSDRWGRKPFLILAAFMSFLPPLCLATLDLTRNGSTFLVYFSMHAIASGVSPGLGLTHAYVSDTTSSSQRAVMMGRVMACGMSLAMISGPLIFAWVADTFGRNGFVYFYACCSAVCPLVTIFIPESRPEAHRSQKECVNPLRSIRLLTNASGSGSFGGGKSTTRLLRTIFLMIFAVYVAKMGILQAQGLFAQEVLGFSPSDAALATSIYGVSQFVGQASLAIILRPISKRTAIFLGCLCGVVGAALVAIPGVPGWILYVSQVPLALSYIAFTIAVAMASQVAPKERVGEAVMAMNLAISFSNTLGPPFFGLCSKAFLDSSYPNGAFLVFSCVMAIGLMLALWLPSDAELHADEKGLDRPLGFSMQPAEPDATLRADLDAARPAGDTTGAAAAAGGS